MTDHRRKSNIPCHDKAHFSYSRSRIRGPEHQWLSGCRRRGGGCRWIPRQGTGLQGAEPGQKAIAARSGGTRRADPGTADPARRGRWMGVPRIVASAVLRAVEAWPQRRGAREWRGLLHAIWLEGLSCQYHFKTRCGCLSGVLEGQFIGAVGFLLRPPGDESQMPAYFPQAHLTECRSFGLRNGATGGRNGWYFACHR